MQQVIEPERWAVVNQLQQRMARRDPSSFEFDTADHAISLVLSSGRPICGFLAHNALRDAKKVTAARKRREQARMQPFYGTGDDEFSDAVLAVCSRMGGDVSDANHPPMDSDAHRQLRVALEQHNRHAIPCFDAWGQGATEKETAAALSISVAYVKKLRRLIRSVATETVLGGSA